MPEIRYNQLMYRRVYMAAKAAESSIKDSNSSTK
jgi:hypothetical protein